MKDKFLPMSCNAKTVPVHQPLQRNKNQWDANGVMTMCIYILTVSETDT